MKNAWKGCSLPYIANIKSGLCSSVVENVASQLYVPALAWLSGSISWVCDVAPDISDEPKYHLYVPSGDAVLVSVHVNVTVSPSNAAPLSPPVIDNSETNIYFYFVFWIELSFIKFTSEMYISDKQVKFD